LSLQASVASLYFEIFAFDGANMGQYFIILMTILLAYLSGSLCAAVIVCKLFGLSDPRDAGSNNPGATNVLRLHGKKYAIMVLVADMLKATIPITLAHLLGLAPVYLAWMGVAAVIGHMYPIFFKFKGGKGVATTLGAYLGINPLLGLIALIIWLGMAKLKGYSSLASLTTAIAVPFIALGFYHNTTIFYPLIGISVLVIAKHHENIERLIHGEEGKIKL
jgi:acyl phosphate:glycerol-3-phosphate acyltransferase